MCGQRYQGITHTLRLLLPVQVVNEYRKTTALIKPSAKTARVWVSLYQEIEKVRPLLLPLLPPLQPPQ
jgi:hypothetical protein